MNITNAPVRGCGTRKEGGLYLCVGLSKNGLPIDNFIIDPPTEWKNGPFRGCHMVSREMDGIEWDDVIMWVGEEYYPTVPSFVEEARKYGISKRVSPKVGFKKIIPNLSRIILVHPKAFYEHKIIPRISPMHSPPTEHKSHDGPCTFALWGHSIHVKRKNSQAEVAKSGSFARTVTTPSCSYSPIEPAYMEAGKFTPGMFMSVGITHFEYVSKDKKRIPKRILDSVNERQIAIVEK